MRYIFLLVLLALSGCEAKIRLSDATTAEESCRVNDGLDYFVKSADFQISSVTAYCKNGVSVKTLYRPK